MTDPAHSPTHAPGRADLRAPGEPRSAADIEHDIDAERGRIRRTLGELEERMSVGAMIDRIGDVMSQDGRAAAQGVGEAVRSNPIPFALIGLGVAWLGVSANRSVSHDDWMHDDEDEGFIDSARQRAAVLQERASNTAGEAGDRAQMMADRARLAADRAQDRLEEKSRNLRRGAGKAGAEARSFFDDNPLAAGALAFATGAALGAMMPNTRSENRALGPRAAEFRHEGREAARDGVDRARRATQAAADTVAHDVSTAVHNLSEEGATAAQEARDRAVGSAERAMGAAERELREPPTPDR
jgi:ElaB/YqjD/DUF883 family membrane-anchored ribosome-binding protein